MRARIGDGKRIRTTRAAVKGHGEPLIDYVSCPAHGKNAYHARKDAKAVAKIMRRKAPESTVEPYACDALPGKWHVGASHRLKDARRDGAA